MAFVYTEVVPWGRSFDEYRRMFALAEAELDRRIVGIGDGPASFNSEMSRRGHHVVSVDPLYALSLSRIRERIEETFSDVLAQTERERHRFVWREIPSVEALGRVRMRAMQRFLDDFPSGKREGRYVTGALPDLPDLGRFDLALCSHLLFLYSEQLSEAFHVEAVDAMLGVADEVRIFPLLDANAHTSHRLEPVCDHLRTRGLDPEIVSVDYEFQKGGNQMLRVRNPRSHGGAS